MQIIEDGFSHVLNQLGNSAIFNKKTGVGTARDSTSHSEISSPLKLSSFELEALYSNSQVIENIITSLPNYGLSSLVGWDIEGNNQRDISFSKDFRDWLEELDFWETFRSALYCSRLYGDGYLVPYIEDADVALPLNLKANNKITNFYYKDQTECYPFDSWQKPEHFQVIPTYVSVNINKSPQPIVTSTKYHKSRLIRCRGKRLFGRALFDNRGNNDSLINQTFRAFSQWELAHSDVKNLLGSHSLFTFGVQGLARKARSEDTQSLFTRFETMLQSMNLMKGIPYDKDSEEVDFITRNFTGVKEAYEILQTQLLSACNLPSYIVFGQTNGSAFSESGLTERLYFDQLVQNYVQLEILPALVKLFSLCKTVKDCPAYGIMQATPIFESTLVLSEEEKANLYEKYSKADTTYHAAGILTEEEIRDSRFANNQKFPSVIQLNPKSFLEKQKELKELKEQNAKTKTEPDKTDVDVDI